MHSLNVIPPTLIVLLQGIFSCHNILSQFLTRFIRKILINHDLSSATTKEEQKKSQSVSYSPLDTPYFLAILSSSTVLTSTIRDNLTPNTASEVSNA